jgi:hypothetical protein
VSILTSAVAARVQARLPARLRARLRARLGLDLAIVLAVVLVTFRLFDVAPWNSLLLDLRTYWETRDGYAYILDPYTIGAYLYAPAFAQVIAPLTALPWPVFSAIWTALICAALIWLAGRWAFPVVLTGSVALEIFLGQIDLFIAMVILIGFRYPAVWAFPLLTKVAPGIGLLWFAVRREWRSLAIALGATVAVAAVSAILAPEAWAAWLNLLRRSLFERQTIEGTYLAIPMGLRLPIAALLVVWGARTDRRWTVPFSVVLAMPILWINVFSLAVAVIALRPEFGTTPARRWLQRHGVLEDVEVPAAPTAAASAPAASAPAAAPESDAPADRAGRPGPGHAGRARRADEAPFV